MLIVSRDILALRLNRVIVAPITQTVRGLPTEIPLGADEGLDVACAASFDNLGPQPVAMLSSRIGRLRDPRTRKPRSTSLRHPDEPDERMTIHTRCMTMISFRVEDDDAAAIQRWAEELGIDRSALLRDSVRQHLNRLASEHDADPRTNSPTS